MHSVPRNLIDASLSALYHLWQYAPPKYHRAQICFDLEDLPETSPHDQSSRDPFRLGLRHLQPYLNSLHQPEMRYNQSAPEVRGGLCFRRARR